jgi:hypoxanthine phosphoribosyltransferase
MYSIQQVATFRYFLNNNEQLRSQKRILLVDGVVGTGSSLSF